MAKNNTCCSIKPIAHLKKIGAKVGLIDDERDALNIIKAILFVQWPI
jgi:hypothetical protein